MTGHHFAGFSNRFWKLLYESRLVPERITFHDDDRLPEWGFGVTNIIARSTPGIDTLLPEEYVGGRKRLRRRNLGHKRSLAAREYALGLEALDRAARGEPLWRVHECVFAILALESEPVDPRL